MHRTKNARDRTQGVHRIQGAHPKPIGTETGDQPLHGRHHGSQTHGRREQNHTRHHQAHRPVKPHPGCRPEPLPRKLRNSRQQQHRRQGPEGRQRLEHGTANPGRRQAIEGRTTPTRTQRQSAKEGRDDAQGGGQLLSETECKHPCPDHLKAQCRGTGRTHRQRQAQRDSRRSNRMGRGHGNISAVTSAQCRRSSHGCPHNSEPASRRQRQIGHDARAGS